MSSVMIPAIRISRQSFYRSPLAFRYPQYASYASQPSNEPQKVQTPVQSQKKEDVVPHQLQPATEGTSFQTPIQAQDPSKFAAGPTKPEPRISDPGPLLTLFGGLIAGSVFVYYYYYYRKDHMEKKWANMVQEAQEKKNGSG